MVKLTSELITQSMQYINPVRDRELDLRGYKIPQIENLGATLDQFDTLDFSDNDIRKLDNFPYLKRLKCLLMNNNRIVRIAEGLEECIPNLESLILTGNQIEELCDIDPLIPLTKLTTLSLLHNPITAKAHYRLYIAFKLPQVTLLDFCKIRQKEREEANTLFKSKKGKELLKEISKKAKISANINISDANKGHSKQELWKIRDAIGKATSLDEVERLSQQLQAGHIPDMGHHHRNGGPSHSNGSHMHDDEEMETDGRH
ncbi:probable U2 small nuclear ribonucleoprotein A' [Chrysoperla carnea]|uniref:probable U2 small nuclear ribonucleoprotein A' n=1 Tax=Chrysoperla carnea TaxID=189513 RepID=UPI001D0934C8|nr:probable U2 small nuclear ribonucleoprotein A' [Chrysoperla carnea]